MADRNADVVVIGAGIVGGAVAHQLSRRGLRVAVIERGEPNQQGSGTTAANIHVQAIHTRRPGQHVPVDVRRLLPLQYAARSRWTDLEIELGTDLGFTPSGGLMLAETAGEVNSLTIKHVWETESGLGTEILSGDQVRSEYPFVAEGVTAATWCALDGFADPQLVTPAYLAAAQRNGAQLVTHSEVRALERVGSEWAVTAGTTVWHSPFVVAASGPWLSTTCAMAGVRLSMKPLAIQMHRLEASDQKLPILVQHVAEGFSAKQDRTGRIVLGGGWPAQSWELDSTPEVRQSSIEGNLAQFRRLLPGLSTAQLDAVWPGPLAASPDEMPVVGEVPGAPGLLVVGGTYSFTLAPLWGDTVAALVLDEPPPVLVADLSPARLVTQGVLHVDPV